MEMLTFDEDNMSDFSAHSRHKAVAEFEESITIDQALFEMGILGAS